jgi:abequosyltransferase
MTAPRLAICIPTYNRAGYIADTIVSVLAQADERIELCISDNASIDGTVAAARAATQGFPATHIAVAPINRGADANYLAAVALAEAEYCLILGSDDILAPGTIAILLDEIERSRPDILLFDRRTCTIAMEPLRVEHALNTPAATDFSMFGSGLDNYMAHAESLCAAFSYISSVVFRKQEWDRADDHTEWIGSAYVHSYKLLSRCCAGARVRYLPEPLVDCRLGNDSFRDKGLCRRVLIDLHGFSRLAGVLADNGHPAAAAHMRALMRKEYTFWRLVRYQSILAADPAWREIIDRLRNDFYIPAGWLAAATGLGRIPGVGRASFILRDLYLKYTT